MKSLLDWITENDLGWMALASAVAPVPVFILIGVFAVHLFIT